MLNSQGSPAAGALVEIVRPVAEGEQRTAPVEVELSKPNPKGYAAEQQAGEMDFGPSAAIRLISCGGSFPRRDQRGCWNPAKL